LPRIAGADIFVPSNVPWLFRTRSHRPARFLCRMWNPPRSAPVRVCAAATVTAAKTF